MAPIFPARRTEKALTQTVATDAHTSPPDTARGARLKKTVTSAVITVAGLGIAGLSMREMPSLETWGRAASPEHLPGVGMFFGLFLIFSIFRALRWRAMLAVRTQVPMPIMLPAFAWCFLLSTFIPYRIGEAARILWAKKLGTDLTLGLGSLIVERINDLVVVSIFGAVVAIAHPDAPDWLLFIGYSLSGSLAGGYLMFIVFIRPVNRWIGPKLRRRQHVIGHRLAQLIETMATLGSPKILIEQLIYSVVVWVLVVWGYHEVLVSLVPNIDWSVSMAVVAAAAFSSVLPAAPGNLGVFEAAVVLVLGAFGHGEGDALVAAVSLHVILLTSIAVTGTLSRLYLGVRGIA